MPQCNSALNIHKTTVIIRTAMTETVIHCSYQCRSPGRQWLSDTYKSINSAHDSWDLGSNTFAAKLQLSPYSYLHLIKLPGIGHLAVNKP